MDNRDNLAVHKLMNTLKTVNIENMYPHKAFTVSVWKATEK